MGWEGRRRVSVLPRVHAAVRGPTVMQGYSLALHKSQLRKVTCRRSLADAVLCLNNASRLLHLSKWQFAVTRCVLEVGSNVERE